MPPALTAETWRGVPAVRLTGDGVSIAIAPSFGARVVSIRDEARDQEWLIGARGPDVPRPRFGDRYIDHPLAGWDEMLPTIDACTAGGVEVPDHGDVWSLPWEYHDDGATVTTTVRARSLPLVLERQVSLTGPRRITLRYALVNIGDATVSWFWAAHPLFVATPSTRLTLPEVAGVVQLTAPDGSVSNRVHAWPPPPSLGLDRLAAIEGDRKFVAAPDRPVSTARLTDEDTGASLALSWSADVAPYLGVWIDGGRWTDAGTFAIEPMTGYYDELRRATDAGRAPALAPADVAEWEVCVEIA